MNDLESLYQYTIGGKRIGLEEATSLFQDDEIPLLNLVTSADRIRQHFFQNRVRLCAIINAKSGGCSEDCAFCAQSAHFATNIDEFPLLSLERSVEAARKAESLGVRCFSLVTSGKTVRSSEERDHLKAIITAIRHSTCLEVAASLGILTVDELKELKEAGLTTYHHNVETAPSFYATICTTHPISERISTIRAAQDAGLTVCAGGILGMGEGPAQRAEFAILLRELSVQRIPVNFLNPIPGTPMEGKRRLRPLEYIRILAGLRFILPDKEIIVCGGREVCLRSLQPLLFLAGANGMMTGDYLTTRGQAPERDLEMIRDLEMEATL